MPLWIQWLWAILDVLGGVLIGGVLAIALAITLHRKEKREAAERLRNRQEKFDEVRKIIASNMRKAISNLDASERQRVEHIRKILQKVQAAKVARRTIGDDNLSAAEIPALILLQTEGIRFDIRAAVDAVRLEMERLMSAIHLLLADDTDIVVASLNDLISQEREDEASELPTTETYSCSTRE